MTEPVSKRLPPLGPLLGTHNTSEAGVATDHVRAGGQPRLQQLLSTGIPLLAIGGSAVVLPVLLVDPPIRFICTKADKNGQRKMLFPPTSLGPVTGKPKLPATGMGEEPFPAVVSNLWLMNFKKKKNKHHYSRSSATVHRSRTCTHLRSELCPLCVRQGKCSIKYPL